MSLIFLFQNQREFCIFYPTMHAKISFIGRVEEEEEKSEEKSDKYFNHH